MPHKKILDNLYLGDQFSNEKKSVWQLKISNIYYEILLSREWENIEYFKNDYFVKTQIKLALNLFDSHDVANFNEVLFAAAVKFIDENILENEIYVHCQLGVSRSAAVVFAYLVIKRKIKNQNFSAALKEFIDNYYPFMKVNYGVYEFLKNNFPFKNIEKLAKMKWDDLQCTT
ncbi:putative protein-tyrosine phosphatase [Spiroplasma clarkii]|uniref:Tyrosine specific protein phosphatases domain-containing protein n=1 Tax=Spiroplasma clarkii TaxID=2139 RepID=A0A1Y0KZW2_9MOLU|nr:dual specificity protein phosphatase [Spiroplasma clarkii]ARU91008.1 putative protein-tyrosine phosphatase [Spiroplasma clarkii]ATX70451.1 hypothetical protein SCLAR_v1c01200 [Spiroplasma clarkii]